MGSEDTFIFSVLLQTKILPPLMSGPGVSVTKPGKYAMVISNTHRKLSSQNELALSIEMLRKIWKPDTFVYNGKKSYLHTITTPNRFVRWDTGD